MRYEKQDDTTHIFMEEGETELQVLQAIALASFELAQPVGMGIMHFKPGNKMTPENAGKYINLNPDNKGDALRMDYVEGRQCKTYIKRVESGHFKLSNNSYERDRGAPDEMLDRADEIITLKAV